MQVFTQHHCEWVLCGYIHVLVVVYIHVLVVQSTTSSNIRDHIHLFGSLVTFPLDMCVFSLAASA